MKIDVPSAAVRSGALADLGICARHGVPATSSRTRKFSTDAPSAAVVFALFSLFIGLLIIAAFQKDVRGPVPECEACRATYRRRITTGWVSLVACIGVIVLSTVARSGPALLGGITLLALGIGSFVRADLGRVRGTLDGDLVWVELRGVDAKFAAAVEARVQLAPEPDPWVAPLG